MSWVFWCLIKRTREGVKLYFWQSYGSGMVESLTNIIRGIMPVGLVPWVRIDYLGCSSNVRICLYAYAYETTG